MTTATRKTGESPPQRPQPPPPRTAGRPPPEGRLPPRLPSPDVPAAAARRVLGRVGRVLIFTLVPVLILAALAAGIGYFRLQQGPVSLMAFARQIEAGIGAEFDGLAARIDDATIALSREGAFEIRLVNLRLAEPDGDLVASAPLAAVELRGGDLAFLRAVPERVYLIEPKLSLSYVDGSGFVLTFSPAEARTEPGANAPAPSEAQGEEGAAPQAALSQNFKKVELVRVLAENSARARRGESSASALREIGLRDATVVLEHEGRRSEIKVLDASIDLEHRKRRSVIQGAAKIESARGPWLLTVRTEERETAGDFNVTASIRDLVPAAVAGQVPQLGFLEALDLPVATDISLDLNTAGDLETATFAVELGRGFVRLPAVPRAPMILDAGLLSFKYDAERKQLALAPSTIKAGSSRVTVEGQAVAAAATERLETWRFAFKSKDGSLAAEEFGVAPIPIDKWTVEGSLAPGDGLMTVDRFVLSAGGTDVTLAGALRQAPGAPGMRLEGAVTPMSVTTLKALWPRPVAPDARTWVGKWVRSGTIERATIRHVSGSMLEAAGEAAGAGPGERRSIAIEAGKIEVAAGADTLPASIPRALVTMENDTVEVTVPEASILAAPGKHIPLKTIKFAMADTATSGSMGEVSFKTQAPVSSVLEAVRTARPELLPASPSPLDGLDGKADGQFKITLALDGSGSGAPPAVEGKMRLTDIQSKTKFGAVALQGGGIDVDITPAALTASGDLILNGALAKIAVQRIFGESDDRQPPVRVTAKLDNADRTQLGLDINHLVQGEMAVDATVTPPASPGEMAKIHVAVDLTPSELAFSDLAWTKPAGKKATVEFDVVKGKSYPLDLHNFRIKGDDIAIEGTMSIDEESEVREFSFPNFSLNVVSRLEVEGKLMASKVWDIRAKGSTYDARDFFRSAVSLTGKGNKEIKPRRPSAGADVWADIGTVIGHGDVSVRGATLRLSERNDQLTALDFRGKLDGGAPLAALLTREGAGPRMLLVDTSDAGQLLKLAGLYQNVTGGRGRLELNLEGKGAADKAGTFWIESFKVLGDPVVTEVFANAGNSSQIDPNTPGARKTVREVFEFDRMRVPFAAGHGQFVIEDSYLKGPIVGATLRGKVDYASRYVTLAGTYVPLQGLNSALGDIPLLGQLLNGPRGEGIFGMTFAIQGPMAEPQVIVNPLSLVAPGIFREIFQLNNPKTKVQPRGDGQGAAPIEDRVRASSSPAEAGAVRAREAPSSATIDGWSSETTAPGSRP